MPPRSRRARRTEESTPPDQDQLLAVEECLASVPVDVVLHTNMLIILTL
jgi:hypothetical protein